MLTDFCNICNVETAFNIAGSMKAGKNSTLTIESWMCTICGNFSIFYVHSVSNKTFILSKNYGHKFIDISYIYNPLTQDVYEIRIAKKNQAGIDGCSLILDPNNLPFELDPTKPDEDIILQKLEVYETFS